MQASDMSIELPRNFNAGTMYPPIMRALNSLETSGLEALDIDFKGLKFIEPVGVVILSNLIEYVIRRNVRVTLSGLSKFSEGTVYLDNSGFFERYLGCKLRPYAKCPPSCLPLTMVSNAQAVGYLHASIIPWLSDVLRTSEASLATIRVCLDEVFSNINFHSGVDFGCMHIQQFKQSNEIQIAISDFGVGIPSNVRRIRENINDSAALKLACEEGFTTQSNVKNRGAGLATLIRYLTTKDRGKVWIVSGNANLSAIHDPTTTFSKVTARTTIGMYPGTLVRITIKPDSIQDLATDVESEEFSW